ncbi:MAG: dynamin family protein [Deltaproteobacteria bacterium]
MDRSEKELLQKLEKLLKGRIQPLFARYGQNIENLLAPLRWKPLVLIIGNYSSGKSTLINELLEREVQRVGQSPTDDSFTIISSPEQPGEEKRIPGGSVVSDERLPFECLKKFGEKLIAHVRLKYVEAPILENLAIIDTPGMLDSVTEKDRGYDYLSVVGELARLSDMIILMFDPHKAGTIKETFKAIRSILPGSTGEDRIFYVLNRIDECQNGPDLVRSYGTLCWNLSQMTGRKDLPRIYLTFTAATEQVPEDFEVYRKERKELRDAVLTAPRLRINHIFEEVERGVRELCMQTETYAAHRALFQQKNKKLARIALYAGLAVVLVGDIVLHLLTGWPETPWLYQVFRGSFKNSSLILPLCGATVIALLAALISRQILMPMQIKKSMEKLDDLIPLQTAYRRDLWHRVRPFIVERFTQYPEKLTWQRHKRTQRKLEKFLAHDLKKMFDRYQHQQED